MTFSSASSGFERNAASSGTASLGIDQGLAEGRLERLNQAAASLLEPLRLNADPDRLSAELAASVQQSAAVAYSVGLRGPDYLAALLVPFLEGPAGRDFIAKDRAAFESWVQEVIAFFAGSMELAQVAGLVSQLDRWLGFAGVPPQFVALIAERLRGDLRQIREWGKQLDPGRYSVKSLEPLIMSGAVQSDETDDIVDVLLPAPDALVEDAVQQVGTDVQIDSNGQVDKSEPPDHDLLPSESEPVGQHIASAKHEAAERQAAADLQSAQTSWTSSPPPRSSISLWPLATDVESWGGASQVAIDELAMLADAARGLGTDLIPTLLSLEPPTGQASWQEFVDEYLARLEHMSNASEFIGAQVLTRVLSGLGAQLGYWMTTEGAISEESRRLLLMIPDTLADLFTDIAPFSVEQLVGLLGDEDWPSALPIASHASLTQALLAIEVVRSRQVTIEPIVMFDENDLSLEIPSEADRSVVDNLLRELPHLSACFSDAIDLLRRGDERQIEHAQRLAHTLKGSANTVGVRGVATLTHRLEDILQLLAKDASALTESLTSLLADAADCLAEMCDAVAGAGPVPLNAEAILREVVDATRVLLDGESVGDRPMPARTEVASVDERITADASEEALAPQAIDAQALETGADRTEGEATAKSVVEPEAVELEALGAESNRASDAVEDAVVAAPDTPIAVDANAGAQTGRLVMAGASIDEDASIGDVALVDVGVDEVLRVPASVVSRLLEFANEAMISLAQMQERITVLGETRAALRAGSERFQDLSMELERLVDVRGLALTGRSREADFDALELDEYNDLHTVSRRFAEAGADHKLVDQQFDQELVAMREQIAQLDRVQTDLRESALKTRMVPIETMSGRLQRAVRQAARQTGKEVELVIFGGETAVDGQLLQRLIDPLMHMLRNAVDHGIEDAAQRIERGKSRTGRIQLAFSRDGAELKIRCVDDGRGLDLDAIVARARAAKLIEDDENPTPSEAARMILLPGFSTRNEATQLSGRGIGLDVVRECVRELRGRIDVASDPGLGLRLTLTMPVRLAAVPVMILRGSNHVIAVSVRDIEQIASIVGLAQDADGGWRLNADGVDYAAVTLESLLGLPEQALLVEGKESVAMIVRGEAGTPMAVIAPEPGQTRNVILQPLAAAIPEVGGIGGVAVMGDGSVAPIVDLPELLARREVAPQYALTLSASAPAAPVCLIVDDSVSVRRSMELFLQDLGMHVESASDGIDAMALVDIRVPDLIIADLEMPRMNGVELANALRARPDTAPVPFIMITSRYSDKHKQLALSAGADIFLTKPYTEDELAGHVRRCLNHGRG